MMSPNSRKTFKGKAFAQIANSPESRIIELMLSAPKIEGGVIVYEGIDDQGVEVTIDMVQQLFNWRLHVTEFRDYGFNYVHGYCYFGLGTNVAIQAFQAGLQWGLAGDPLNTDPDGFSKKAF
jgi:hypothetical protein